MARFEDTPNLFGGGAGVGTYGNFKCDVCNTVWDNREDGNGDILGDHDAIRWTEFAGFQVCGDCFGKIENAVLERVDDLLPWLARILASKSNLIERRILMIKKITKALLRPA